MIEIIPTKEQKERAEARTKKALEYNDTKAVEKFGARPDAVFRGFLGEELFIDYHKKCKLVSHWNYDVVTDKGKKLDIKTILCRSKPLEHYCVNVVSPNLQKFTCAIQDRPDYFVFFRMLEDMSKAWLLGYKSLEEYRKEGWYFAQGESILDMHFNTGEALVMPISELNKFI